MRRPARAGTEGGVIVVLPTPPPSTSRPTVEPRQLELGFDAERCLVLISTEKIHGAGFLRILSSKRPAALIDLRFAPHFEFTGVPSSTLFRSVERTGVQYFVHSIPFHEIRTTLLKHDPMRLAMEILNTTSKNGPQRGPIMVLFQHREDADAFGPYLRGAIEQLEGRQWTTELFA